MDEVGMKRVLLLAWLAVCSPLAIRFAHAEDKPVPAQAYKAPAPAAEPQFVRVRRDEKGQPQAMETAVVHYIPAQGGAEGVSVDLIGAVHVGDKSYYDQLNKLFESYDVLLYELVAPEGTKIPKEGRKGPSSHPIG